MPKEELDIHWVIDFVYSGSNSCMRSILLGSLVRLFANVQLLHKLSHEILHFFPLHYDVIILCDCDLPKIPDEVSLVFSSLFSMDL